MDDELLDEILFILDSAEHVDAGAAIEILLVMGEFGAVGDHEIISVISTLHDEGWVDRRKLAELLDMLIAMREKSVLRELGSNIQAPNDLGKVVINRYGELI